MDLVEIKAQSRASNHAFFAVAVLWSDDGGVTWSPPEADKEVFSARLHNKLVRQGDQGGDYMDIIEGIERLVFNAEQLDALDITLSRGDLIQFPGYGITVELDQHEQDDGPLNRYWHVTRA